MNLARFGGLFSCLDFGDNFGILGTERTQQGDLK